MRILIHGLNFAPELTGIGKYTGEMAEWLAQRGHDVRVVAAPPYYPQWKVLPGYRANRYVTEAWRGVNVWRCPLWVPARPSGPSRLLHLLSFALASAPVMVRQAGWRPDVVWVVAPALFSAPAAWLAARLSGASCWLHIQDYELDAAFELGLLRGGMVQQVVARAESGLLRRFDRVSTISRKMRTRALEKGVQPSRLLVFANWVELGTVEPPRGPNSFRAELGITRNCVVALYSGNMGRKQGVELLAQAADILRGESGLMFVFCGNGPIRAELERLSGGLPNIRFLDLQPVERLGTLLAMPDIHLLPQRASAADLVLPSKLTGMMASGRPVIATARDGTDLAQIVKDCGVVVPPEDPGALAEAIQALAANPERRAVLGAAGRRYAEEHLSRDRILEEFEAELVKLVRYRQ